MIVDARGREVDGGNGADLTERQKAKVMALNCTVGEANHIAHMHAVQSANHLGNQIPGLIHSVVAAAIQGYHASLVARGVVPPDAPVAPPEPPPGPVDAGTVEWT